ncbi:DUF551 domain-containing protein [Escherichia coli]|nr:DUF551 domain-containing protein [Escherichia coli O2]EGO6591592.1 DUF551 domain-containing protein [Escherichia coli]EJK7920667.1 DUF551 domain-containing protein [Escherichia coli]EJK7935344.1 DUF551 domain-containing protein [Escherichia coli]EJK9292800.1 DUF551 domain-containing protein [Escherichia coli]
MTIDYQALRDVAVKAGKDKWQAKKINGDFFVIRHGSYTRQHGYTSYQPIAEIDCKPVRDFVAKANPATVLELLDELEAAKKRIAELEAEPVSQTYKLPPLSSNEVNDAAWKLHNMLTEHGPLNGHQLNNLKGCFYEALKVAMRNTLVSPGGWISCSERMPDKLIPVMVMYEDGEMWSAMWNGNRWDDGTEYPDPHSVTHWREMPAAPKQEVNRG